MDAKRHVEDKDKLENRSETSRSPSSNTAVATEDPGNESLSSEGYDEDATHSYITRTTRKFRAFENRFKHTSSHPQEEGDISDFYDVAWERLRNKRLERIPDDRKTELVAESISKLHVSTAQSNDNDPSPPSQNVGSSEASVQQSNNLQQDQAIVKDKKLENVDVYTYERLQKDDGEHRLLVLHPGSFSDTIRVSLVHVLFSQPPIPGYEAISYVCGDAKNNLVAVRIINNDTGRDEGQLKIGQNLALALRYLRLADNPRTMWCDALCINQQINDEKSAEILAMSDIYRKAQRTVVWLGPEADESGVALKTLSHLGNQIAFEEGGTVGTAEGKDPNWCFVNRPLPFDDATWRSIGKLIARTWFKRLWIWQEVALADEKAALIVCGYDQMLWDLFRRAIMCLFIKLSRPTGMSEADLRLYETDLCSASNLVRAKNLGDIMNILAFTRDCQCYDAKDRVYAILSFQDDHSSLSRYIQPDYRKPKFQVYLDLFLAYREHLEFTLDIFVFSGLGKGDTPTWLPD